MMEKAKTIVNREDRLLKVLSIVTDWLKFAETKNAVLLAFNGASIYGIAKAMELNFFKEHDGWLIYAVIVIIILSFSVVTSLISFVPRLKLISLGKHQDKSNSLFFDHLKNKTETQIIQAICETNETEFTSFENDLANQIKQNSDIASNKYSYFTVAVWITMTAYLTPVIAGIFAIYTYMQRIEIK